jgi:RNA polymerase sigma-70 factor, ECF subfamily
MGNRVDLAETRLKALMLASLDGDAAAYRGLLAALAPHLRAYYARRLAQAADAEDLVQETLIAIHTRRATYDASLPFTAWLHAIARYKLIDHYRRAKVRRALPLEEADSVTAEENHEAAEAARDVERLLAALPEGRRALIRQVKIEGLSTAEAAARSGMSESAVKVAIHRGLKKLSALIGEKP